MAKRKKKRKGASLDGAAPDAVDVKPKPPPAIGTSLGGLLSKITLDHAKPRAPQPPKKKTAPPAPRAPAPIAPATPTGPVARPSETLRGDDRIAYYDAMAGARPFGKNTRARPVDEPRTRPPGPAPALARGDEEARARLAALVAGGVRFELSREDDAVRGRRVGTPPRVVDALGRRGVIPEATLDLHGMRAEEAERELVRFLRAQHRRGARRVCVVTGKGNHSVHGIAVLREAAIHALTEAGAAPVVLAFASAPIELGGTGALVVELVR